MRKNGTIETCVCGKQFYCKAYRKRDNIKLGVSCSRKCFGIALSKSRMGIKRSPEIFAKISRALKGRKLSAEHVEKLKRIPHPTGENSFHWKGGVTLSSYRRMNPAKAKYWKKKRYGRETKAGGGHSTTQWEELKMKYRYMCLCCKKSEPEIILSKDHIIPLSRGGDNNIENLQPLCRSCNSKKYTRIINYLK